MIRNTKSVAIMDNFDAWEELGSTEVELDMETGVAIQSPTNASGVFPDGLDAVFTTDQSRYNVSSPIPSGTVVVKGFGPDSLIYEIPGLAYSNQEDIIFFYSESEQSIFFIYPKEEQINSFSISSCGIEKNSSCVSSDMTLYWPFFANSSRGIKVYDQIGLVGIPNTQSSCEEYLYYSFNKTSLVKSIKTLNKIFTPVGVDSRTGIVYSVEGGGNKAIKITSEKITDGDVPIRTARTERVKISRQSMRFFFKEPHKSLRVKR